jgi:hypothetical protein
MAVWYVRDNSTVATDTLALSLGSIGWSNMTGWSASASISAGALRRQSAGAAAFTASSSGTTLTVTAVSAGTIYLGMHIQSSGGTTGLITAFGTGSGGTGTYTWTPGGTISSTTWNGGLQAGNERAFVAIVGGTTGSTEPNWTLTKGAKTTDNTVTWQECTGQPAVNGDLTDTPNWTSVKNTSVSLGKIITDNAGTHIFICSTAGTAGNGSEPSWNTSAIGNTTADNTVTWTYIGTSFSNWAAPHARLNNAGASTWGAAGDSFYFADDHAEITQPVASTILSLPGTNASPNFCYSIDHTLSLPVSSGGLKTGASISVQSGTLSVNGSSTGQCAYFYGFSFTVGNGGSGVGNLDFGFSIAASWTKLDSCALRLNNTNTGSGIITGNTNTALVELINTTMQFGATAQILRANTVGKAIWRNTASAIQGATIPTNLLSGGSQGVMILEGIDLSALGSNTIVAAGTSALSSALFSLVDCKLGSGAVIAATPVNSGGPFVDAIRCDSGGTTYVQRRYWYQGTLSEETTIVRTGGASDGITPISWKIVTTANSKWVSPFEAFPISIWNAITGGNVTVTVYGIWGGGAVPNNDDIWIEVEYLGSASSPLASFADSTKSNNLATASALSSDGSSWGGSTTPFKMSVTLSSPQPQLAGYLRVYVKAAKASSTFYIDPLPVLS